MPIQYFIINFIFVSVCVFKVRQFPRQINNTLNLYKSMAILTILFFVFGVFFVVIACNLKRLNMSFIDFNKTQEPFYIAMIINIIIFSLILLYLCYRTNRLLKYGQEVYTKAKVIVPSYKKIDTSNPTSEIDIVLYGHNPYTGNDLELKTTIKFNIQLQHQVISPIRDGDLVTVYISSGNENLYIVDLRDFYRWPKRT